MISFGVGAVRQRPGELGADLQGAAAREKAGRRGGDPEGLRAFRCSVCPRRTVPPTFNLLGDGRLPITVVSVDAGFATSSVRRQCQQRWWWLPVVGRSGVASTGRAASNSCQDSPGSGVGVRRQTGVERMPPRARHLASRARTPVSSNAAAAVRVDAHGLRSRLVRGRAPWLARGGPAAPLAVRLLCSNGSLRIAAPGFYARRRDPTRGLVHRPEPNDATS